MATALTGKEVPVPNEMVEVGDAYQLTTELENVFAVSVPDAGVPQPMVPKVLTVGSCTDTVRMKAAEQPIVFVPTTE